MIFNVIPTPHFKRQAKRLLKRYPSLSEELSEFEKSLQANPEQGTPLGNKVYKIRLAIKSKGKGKSSGARIITYVVTSDLEVYLLSIYDKSDVSIIDDKTLKALVEETKSGKKN
jgi:mRNA-degrading endonuclease RelE of RelBE toxin-antitoxin system